MAEVEEEVSHVLSFGSNEYGQLGHGKIGKFYNRNTPQVIHRASGAADGSAGGNGYTMLDA